MLPPPCLCYMHHMFVLTHKGMSIRPSTSNLSILVHAYPLRRALPQPRRLLGVCGVWRRVCGGAARRRAVCERRVLGDRQPHELCEGIAAGQVDQQIVCCMLRLQRQRRRPIISSLLHCVLVQASTPICVTHNNSPWGPGKCATRQHSWLQRGADAAPSAETSAAAWRAWRHRSCWRMAWRCDSWCWRLSCVT